MHPREFINKNVLVLGLGREGVSTIRYLKEHFPELSLGAADRKVVEDLSGDTKELVRDLNCHLGEDYLSSISDYDVIIKAPGISARTPEIAKALKGSAKITSATNIFFSTVRGPVIGVSGTKGKSTTSSLVHAIFERAGFSSKLLGNIGTPALSCLEENSENTLYVFELSSYQLEDFTGSLSVGVLLNLFPEHLDYHGGCNEYYAAKLNLVRGVSPKGALVFNSKYPLVSELAAHGSYVKLSFGEAGNEVIDRRILVDNEPYLLEKEVGLIGAMNLENALAAILVSRFLGVSDEVIKKAIREFEPLEHRLEFIGTFRDIEFVNDAISTTPESTIAALDALGPRVGTLFLGGLDRGYDFSKLAERVVSSGIETVVLFPQSGERIWTEIKKARTSGMMPKHFFVNDMKSAVEIAFENTSAGKVCLLSTASPSYSLWKDFEEKGSQFKHWIRAQP